MDIKDVINKPIKELGLNERCLIMGFLTLKDILNLEPRQLISTVGLITTGLETL